MNVFFMSYNESNCESNWKTILSFHPNTIRLHGIKGIDKVHNTADSLATTPYFWTVDGDNCLTKQLNYIINDDTDLFMFKGIDPIINKHTLLGGVKLWKKNSIIHKTMEKGDFCLNATKTKKILDDTYSIVEYNSSPYDTWKTAFRHCVKLLSCIFRNKTSKNIDMYLLQWQSCKDLKTKNAEWAYKGYLSAKEYVDKYDNNLRELNKINDYYWLKNYYEITFARS